MQKIDPTVREIDSHTVEQRDTHTYTHTTQAHFKKQPSLADMLCLTGGNALDLEPSV